MTINFTCRYVLAIGFGFTINLPHSIAPTPIKQGAINSSVSVKEAEEAQLLFVWSYTQNMDGSAGYTWMYCWTITQHFNQRQLMHTSLRENLPMATSVSLLHVWHISNN